MSSFLILLRRRLRRFRFPYLLAAFLVTTVMAAALLYQGYINALSNQFKGSISYPTIPGEIIAWRPVGVADPTYVTIEAVLELRLHQIRTRHGALQVAGLSRSQLSDWPTPEGNDVWLPASLRGEVFQEDEGDLLTLTFFSDHTQMSREARVAGYYADGGYLSPLLVNQAWLASWLEAPPEISISAYPEKAQGELKHWVDRNPGARLIRQDDVVQAAHDLVNTVYAGGSGALALGLVFLALGLGTLALLVFLDSRPEFAVLKALGLKPRTVSGLLWAEFACAVLAGSVIGIGLVPVFQRFVNFPLTLDRRLVASGLLLTGSAFLLSLASPTRLARVALVNELMLQRPILLWKKIVSSGSKHHPAFHDLAAQGLTYVKLAQDGEGFQGAILTEPGRSVKQGETLAWEAVWFGMGEKHYVAPSNGLVVVADSQRGVLAIKPYTEEGGDALGHGTAENC